MLPVDTAPETPFGGPLEAGPDGVEPEYLRDARYRETACRSFYYAACKIPNIRIEVRKNVPLSRQTIRVFVPDLDRKTERQVRRLEFQIVSRFPRSGLDVWVTPED